MIQLAKNILEYMGDRVVRMLLPAEHTRLSQWLENNNWFVIVYICIVIFGVIISLGQRNQHTNMGQKEYTPPKPSVIKTQPKTLQPITNYLLGYGLGVAIPMILVGVAYLLYLVFA